MGPIGIGLFLGSLGLNLFGQRKERKEMAERLEWEAEQRRQKAGQLSTLTIERLHDIEKEKYYAKGTAKATQSAAGVKVGVESALTQLKALEGAHRRKQEVLGKQSGMQIYGLEQEASELEKRARKMKKTDWWSMGATALSGGFQLGSAMEWWG